MNSGLDTLARTLKRAGRRGLNLFFPPGCAACDRQVAQSDALCPQCWSSVSFIEKPYCAILGLPFSRDLGDGVVSAEAIAHPPDFDRLRSVALHEGVVRALVHQLKYRDRPELAPMLARWMLRAGGEWVAKADLIVPVPCTDAPLSRRYNQAGELARHVGHLSGKPFLAAGLARRKRTERQVGLTQRQRLDNLAGAFALDDPGKAAVMGRRIVLIDDVYTTGATVSAAARTLRKAGAIDITVLTVARALAGPI